MGNIGNIGKHIPIFTSAVLIVFVILSLLLTRQIIFFDNTLQTFVFLLGSITVLDIAIYIKRK